MKYPSKVVLIALIEGSLLIFGISVSKIFDLMILYKALTSYST